MKKYTLPQSLFILGFLPVILFGSDYIIYIDPNNLNDPFENGSISHPYDSWFDVNWSSGSQFLQKRGTTSFDPIVVPVSGTQSKKITIGAYSSGEKPMIKGSCILKDSSQWDHNGNIWFTKPWTWDVDSNELIENPSFDSNALGWNLYVDPNPNKTVNGGRTTIPGEYYTIPAGYKITCSDTGCSNQFCTGSAGNGQNRGRI